MNQSKFVINNVNLLDQRYKLNDFSDLEIIVLSTLKYTGTNKDTGAGLYTLNDSYFTCAYTIAIILSLYWRWKKAWKNSAIILI